jgi:hypothetical protein
VTWDTGEADPPANSQNLQQLENAAAAAAAAAAASVAAAAAPPPPRDAQIAEWRVELANAKTQLAAIQAAVAIACNYNLGDNYAAFQATCLQVNMDNLDAEQRLATKIRDLTIALLQAGGLIR